MYVCIGHLGHQNTTDRWKIFITVSQSILILTQGYLIHWVKQELHL